MSVRVCVCACVCMLIGMCGTVWINTYMHFCVLACACVYPQSQQGVFFLSRADQRDISILK